jgi:hypothetical protein
MIHRICLMSLASVAALLFVCGVDARQNKGGPTNKPAGQAAQATHAALIAELQQIHTLLSQAKHDYQGHRASAAGHVHKAIHALNHGNKTNATGQQAKPNKPATVNKPANTNAIKETQAASDTQLKEALAGLNSIQNQLASLPQGPKHAHAQEHLKKAINELNTALKIK